MAHRFNASMFYRRYVAPLWRIVAAFVAGQTSIPFRIYRVVAGVAGPQGIDRDTPACVQLQGPNGK